MVKVQGTDRYCCACQEGDHAKEGRPKGAACQKAAISTLFHRTAYCSENGKKRQADRVAHDALRITRKADFTSREGAIL